MYFFILSQFVFLLWNIVPGDVADALWGDRLSVEDKKIFLLQLGWDERFFTRLKNFETNLFSSSLTHSWTFYKPVVLLIAERSLYTFFLALWSLLLMLLVSIPLSLWVIDKAKLKNFFQYSLSAFLAFPLITLAPVLLYVCVKHIPGFSFSSSNFYFPPWLAVFLLSFSTSVITVKLLLDSLGDVIRTPLVVALRAKGLSRVYIKSKHLLKILLPVLLNHTAAILSSLLGGSLIIETLFEIPGLGSLFYEALNSRDLPLINGLVITLGGVYILCFTAAETVVKIFYPQKEV